MDNDLIEQALSSILGRLSTEQLEEIEQDVDNIRSQVSSGFTQITSLTEEREQFTKDIETANNERDNIKQKYYDRFINGSSSDFDEESETPKKPEQKTEVKELSEIFNQKV